jgi:O-antigen ligase
VYGAYIGDVRWDPRVHANNMYLEVLAGGGVIGLASLLWLVAASGYALWIRWSRATPLVAPAAAAFAATWLAITTHGMVDSFLSFTPTYVTFAIVAGLAFSSGSGHADRV